MADGLVKMSDQFGGLPMDQLIGGPLKAACDAQVQLAKASSDFIQTVGLEKQGDALAARTVDFSFTRPVNKGDGSPSEEQVDLKVPLLAILNTPALGVKEVDIDFTMEVKSSTSDTASRDYKATMDTEVKAGWGPVSVDVKIHGSVASHSENVRKSDNSAKYNVHVVARDDGMPEGMSKVLDMLNSAIAPRALSNDPQPALPEGGGKKKS